MRKRLVYRADDVGYTLAFDLGAFKAIDEGIVTSADVMFDSPHTEEALQWLKERPWISIGWHRHLWESPVLPASEVPHMVDAEGRFKWRHLHAELMDEVPYEEAYKEFETEMARCYAILGRYPDTASLRPQKNELERAFADICQKCQINVNVTNGSKIASSTASYFSQKRDSKFDHLNFQSWIVHPDNGKGDGSKESEYDLKFFSSYDTTANIMGIQWDNEEEIIMTGGHPGYLDDHILAESRCTIHRVRELQGAISPKVKQWIIENHVELVNQRDVLFGTNEYQDHLKAVNSPLWIGNM